MPGAYTGGSAARVFLGRTSKWSMKCLVDPHVWVKRDGFQRYASAVRSRSEAGKRCGRDSRTANSGT